MTSPDSQFPRVVPVLTDGHTLLRAHRPTDVPRIVEQCVDPDSVRWTMVPAPYTEDDAREWLEQIGRDWESTSGPRLWAVAHAAFPDTFLGSIDVRPRGAGIASVGFGLHPAGRGRHLMTGALRLATQWWFDQGGVRMIWEANRGNFASWRVAHACGFTFHGILPQHLEHRGEAVDVYYGSVGRQDDLSRPATPWLAGPQREADGIRLRAWREEDIEAAPEVDDTPRHFVPPRAVPTKETFRDWRLRRTELVAQGKVVDWCIADAETDVALGNIILILDGQEAGSAEVGYFLFPAARGRGAATKACRLVLDFAYAPEPNGLGLRRLTALTLADNVPSARVLERVGFTEWGREPQTIAREDGSFDDAQHWARFPD